MDGEGFTIFTTPITYFGADGEESNSDTGTGLTTNNVHMYARIPKPVQGYVSPYQVRIHMYARYLEVPGTKYGMSCRILGRKSHILGCLLPEFEKNVSGSRAMKNEDDGLRRDRPLSYVTIIQMAYRSTYSQGLPQGFSSPCYTPTRFYSLLHYS
jgi:hypothetical protein